MGAAQDAKSWRQRSKVEEGGGGSLGYGWDSAVWGVNVQGGLEAHESLPPTGAAQDAKNWWQRNKVEEGGGGYLGYGWDSAIWGVNMLGRGENLDPETLPKLCRTPRTGGSATRWRRAAAGT